MTKIDIGFLLPSSTILPVAKDFETGLRDGLNSYTEQSIVVNVIPEFIGQGSLQQTEDACNKLFNYHDADVITGVVSNRVAEAVADKFKARKKPFIVNNAGGHIPDISKLNEYVFINSLHLWQHAWTLGNFGVQQFGKKGMFVGGVYDAGYSFSHMFYLGMQAANPESEWSFSVPPMPPAGGLSDMTVIFPFLETYQPDFIFAAFCGAETTLFLNEFIARGWHKKTRIAGLPFLLAPFNPVTEDIKVYTTLPFPDTSQSAEKSFYHLGYKTGVNLVKAAVQSDGTNLHQYLEMSNVFSLGSETVAINENIIDANQNNFQKGTLIHAPTFIANSEQLKSVTNEITVSWLNPYLCI